MEITHFGRQAVACGGWVLAAKGGQWAIPTGVTLVPGRPVVLAGDLKAYRARYPGAPAPVLLPGLTLHAAQDTLTLKRSAEGATVDEVAWGGARPGWKLPGAARGGLCRPNPGKDTNTYLDWAPTDKGTPGTGGCGN